MRSFVILALVLGLAACGSSETQGEPRRQDTDDVAGDDDIGGDTDPGDDDATDADPSDEDETDTDTMCPDDDEDYLCNEVDTCVGTDSSGDTDADGVCNDTDLCAGDDALGDTDADGVCDDTDICVGDDALGDTDGDGTCDDLDACIGDDAQGDSDTDGVCNELDGCPDNAARIAGPCEPSLVGSFATSESYGSIATAYPYVTALLVAPAACDEATLGDTAFFGDGETGTVTFDSGEAFDTMATCLTNGNADTYVFWAAFSHGANQAHAGAGAMRAETTFGGEPDFANVGIAKIELHVTASSVAHDGGGTSAGLDYEWRFYGYVPTP